MCGFCVVLVFSQDTFGPFLADETAVHRVPAYSNLRWTFFVWTAVETERGKNVTPQEKLKITWCVIFVHFAFWMYKYSNDSRLSLTYPQTERKSSAQHGVWGWRKVDDGGPGGGKKYDRKTFYNINQSWISSSSGGKEKQAQQSCF